MLKGVLFKMEKSKLNVTKHTLQRWAERILKIDNDEVNLYINSNRDMLVENINETFSYSEFIYKGQLGKDNITRHYYIQNDIVFITNTENNAIITVYKVDLGFTDELNSQVRKGLIEEVRKLQIEKDELDFQSLSESELKKHEVVTIDDQIHILEKQIAELKAQKQIVNNELKMINSKSSYVTQELSKFVLMLVNSIDYKNDIQTI